MSPLKFKSDMELFEQEVERRDIKRLVHFTTANNLFSIYEQGFLMSKDQLDKLSKENPGLHVVDYVIFNDEMRIDNRTDHINISIEKPNHWLFRKFREKYKGSIDTWCVISLSTDCLYLEDTLFSVGNAASFYSKRCGIGGSFDHFTAMFQNTLNTGTRVFDRNGKKDCQPTDDQAEVLVKGMIPISMIQDVSFLSDHDLRAAKGAVSILCSEVSLQFKVDESLFV